jgi:hypothetical protein
MSKLQIHCFSCDTDNNDWTLQARGSQNVAGHSYLHQSQEHHLESLSKESENSGNLLLIHDNATCEMNQVILEEYSSCQHHHMEVHSY